MTLAQLIFQARQRVPSRRPERSFAGQAEFAYAIGVDAMTVSRWERGSQRPEPERLSQILTLADLPADYFEQAA
jgi:transcriptional regulator with XRE-family HTH domain